MYFFVSYSSDNEEVSQGIFDTLINLNIKYWGDRSEIGPSDNMETKISSAINETTGSIIIISKGYFKKREVRNWCQFELDMILKRAKMGNYNIIPIFLDKIDEIGKGIDDEAKLLLKEVSSYRGFDILNSYDIGQLEAFKDFIKSLNGSSQSIIKDKHGNYIYWGIEYGIISGFMKDDSYYYNIDMVHSDEGRSYVIIGKIEITTPMKLNKNIDVKLFKESIQRDLIKHIKLNKESYKITFKDTKVQRIDFKFKYGKTNAYCRYTGRVNGNYPYGKDIYIDYYDGIIEALGNSN